MAAITRECQQRRRTDPCLVAMLGPRPGRRRGKLWASVLVGLIVTAPSGCTIIEIADSDGATRIERRVGFTSITVRPTREAVVARLRSFGLANTPLGFTAGYAMHQLAALGTDCRVVFWVESEQEIQALKKLAPTLREVCIINLNRGDDQ
jgi:hypothetical protein